MGGVVHTYPSSSGFTGPSMASRGRPAPPAISSGPRDVAACSEAVRGPAVELVVASVTDPAAADLVGKAEAELCERYQAPSIGRLRARELEPCAGGLFVVAYLERIPVGCGGYRRLEEGTAEVKRLFVEPAGRRRGVARAVLGYLHQQATVAGYRRMWLETGTLQPEAIALYQSVGYQSTGYQRIGCFGEHGHDDRSRYFALELAQASQ